MPYLRYERHCRNLDMDWSVDVYHRTLLVWGPSHDEGRIDMGRGSRWRALSLAARKRDWNRCQTRGDIAPIKYSPWLSAVGCSGGNGGGGGNRTLRPLFLRLPACALPRHWRRVCGTQGGVIPSSSITYGGRDGGTNTRITSARLAAFDRTVVGQTQKTSNHSPIRSADRPGRMRVRYVHE
jgi:hypothetical protein